MLNQSEDALTRWKGFDEAIDRWLDERHELIVMLTGFAAHRDFNDPDSANKLNSFNTLLIDYISAGHFEFYQRLIEEGEEYNEVEGIKYSKTILAGIDASTGLALKFTEKYETANNLTSIEADISSLAESLETRFEAEDQLIDLLHGVHQSRVQTKG